jgi:hypothetical protein
LRHVPKKNSVSLTVLAFDFLITGSSAITNYSACKGTPSPDCSLFAYCKSDFFACRCVSICWFSNSAWVKSRYNAYVPTQRDSLFLTCWLPFSFLLRFIKSQVVARKRRIHDPRRRFHWSAIHHPLVIWNFDFIFWAFPFLTRPDTRFFNDCIWTFQGSWLKSILLWLQSSLAGRVGQTRLRRAGHRPLRRTHLVARQTSSHFARWSLPVQR